MKFLQGIITTQLRYVLLRHEMLTFYVFVESRYINNRELTTKIEIIIYLVDDKKGCQIINWVFFKCQGVARSVLAGETYRLPMEYD